MMKVKAKCPKCGSTNVYRYVSVGAKQKLNGTQRIYEFGHGGLDNLFELCGWEGNIYDIENYTGD